MIDATQAFTTMSAYEEDDYLPVSRITAGAIGELRSRLLVLQAHIGEETFSWAVEKEQALALSRAIPELLKAIAASFPELSAPLVAAQPNLALSEPVELLFRVGSLGVSYDRLHDLVVLILVDARLLYGDLTDADLDETHEPGQRLYTTRGQALLLSQQVARAVTAGRPTCPLCQEPIDDFGHFCLPATARNRRTGEFLH